MPTPVYSQADTWLKFSSSRKASPSDVWLSSREWLPQDSSPFVAGTQIRPSLRSDSLIRVSLLGCSPVRGCMSVDLRVAGVGQVCAPLVRAPDSRGIGAPAESRFYDGEGIRREGV